MARFSAGARAAGAGSATLPIGSVYAAASGANPRLREIGISNTTTTDVVVGLARLTGTGTQGAGLVETPHDATGGAANNTAFNTHTVTPTTIVDLGYRFILTAKAGVIWTFNNDIGLTIANGTGNGIGIYIPTGTGQVCDFYFVWDE